MLYFLLVAANEIYCRLLRGDVEVVSVSVVGEEANGLCDDEALEIESG